jgi:hypothetical protein
MTLNKNLHWCIYIMFLLSCARQSSPTGGPKDTIPPVLVRAIPPDETVHFKAKELQLIFSEDVILNTPKEQLIVTPTIGKDYKITYRRNIVVIEFQHPLEDSTTYTFNFRESIQDITEKNPVRNLQLAYSTGHYLDSLSIEGSVYHLLTGKPAKDATVALHVENDTFNIMEHPAVYFTKTDEDGNYKISHLKPDNYFLYAIQDENRNLIVNSRNESYGFLSEYQYLLDTISNASVGLIRLDAGPLEITTARPYNTYFNIRTTKNLRTFKITATDSSELAYTFGENQTNIRVYDTIEQDSIEFHLLALDSIDNAIDTTLYAKFLQREVTPEDFKLSVTQSSLLAHTGKLQATLHFSKPLKGINFDSIYYQIDSLTRVTFSTEDLTWDALQRTITIQKTMDPSLFNRDETNGHARRGSRLKSPAMEQPSEKNVPVINELNLRTAAFISIEDDTSQQTVQGVTPLAAEDLAVINVEIRTAEENYLVQLVDNKYKVVRQISNQPIARFANLVPAEYHIRLVIDRNHNGRWDPGNYFQLVQPEPIIYYRGPDGSTAIKGVKANWDVGAGEMFITY